MLPAGQLLGVHEYASEYITVSAVLPTVRCPRDHKVAQCDQVCTKSWKASFNCSVVFEVETSVARRLLKHRAFAVSPVLFESGDRHI